MSTFPVPWGNYLLEGLAETNAPESISWLPQTIGWQCVLLVLVILVVRKIYQAVKLYQHNIYRRNALAWLNNLPAYQADSPDIIYRQLPSLLRKVALKANKRQDVCQLSHSAWELWLDEQCVKTDFSGANAELLYQVAYVPNYQINDQQMQSLLSEIATWVKYHRGQYD